MLEPHIPRHLIIRLLHSVAAILKHLYQHLGCNLSEAAHEIMKAEFLCRKFAQAGR